MPGHRLLRQRRAEICSDAIKDELKIEVGETTEDKLVYVCRRRVALGACGLAPVMMIDDKIYGELTPDKAIELLRGFRKAGKAAASAA